jgi:lysophospholipid acyltransferase (LPLAT)-like uncharacterized protein
MNLKELSATLKTAVGGFITAFLLKVISASIRWQEPVGCKTQPDVGAIVTFWHGRLLMIPSLYRRVWRQRKRIPYVLISQHGDGRLIATAVGLLGFRSVAGSSTRGGRRALLELIRRGRAGHDIGFTPDGPRGPRHYCKEGIVTLAKKAAMPVIPFAYSVERKWQLRSWDGMIIPKPFSKGVLVVGEPVIIAEDEEQESARNRVQEALDQVTRQADAYWSAA